jgi:hypothetical protein
MLASPVSSLMKITGLMKTSGEGPQACFAFEPLAFEPLAFEPIPFEPIVRARLRTGGLRCSIS